MTRRIRPAHFEDSNAAAHFQDGSALHEFIAGRLGAPGCWPPRKHGVADVPTERRSIERWETDGGKTSATRAPAKAAQPHSRFFA
jgi:hypothetical protein